MKIKHNAAEKLATDIEKNFKNGILHITLTYEKEPSKEEVKKRIAKFKRDLNRLCKNSGTNSKWFTETKRNMRTCHHVICDSQVDKIAAKKLWGYGLTIGGYITGPYIKLANYLLRCEKEIM